MQEIAPIPGTVFECWLHTETTFWKVKILQQPNEKLLFTVFRSKPSQQSTWEKECENSVFSWVSFWLRSLGLWKDVLQVLHSLQNVCERKTTSDWKYLLLAFQCIFIPLLKPYLGEAVFYRHMTRGREMALSWKVFLWKWAGRHSPSRARWVPSKNNFIQSLKKTIFQETTITTVPSKDW